jgi:hypothetical protein
MFIETQIKPSHLNLVCGTAGSGGETVPHSVSSEKIAILRTSVHHF